LHAGANLVDVSKALGHSSCAITSLYLHASDKPVSSLIDLSTLVDGETVDDTITYVKTEKTSKKVRDFALTLTKSIIKSEVTTRKCWLPTKSNVTHVAHCFIKNEFTESSLQPIASIFIYMSSINVYDPFGT